MEKEFEIIESNLGAKAGRVVDTAGSREEAIEKAKAKKADNSDRQFTVQDKAGISSIQRTV